MCICTETQITTIEQKQQLPHNMLKDSAAADSDWYGKDEIKFVLDQLTTEEMELAASSSYQYQKCRIPSARQKFASEMAMRYITSKSDKDVALIKMKATLKFREEMNLHNLDQLTKDSNEELTKYLNDKKSYVQGFDKDGRATFMFIPRLSTDQCNLNRTVLGHVWTIEKAIACTKAEDGTINVVVDFGGFSVYSHSPSFKVGKEVMTVLRNHYVGHIHKIFLLNVPTSFSILWSIFKPFAGSKTRSKIVFASSSSVSPSSFDSEATQDENLLCQYYCTNEATSWMREDGTKNNELQVDAYLNKLPFDQAYDDENR